MVKLNPMLKWLPYIGILSVYVSGAFVDIMEVDAAQYASIAREMLESGSYLEVHNRSADYLDKPPLLFWLSSLSMKLFGIGNWQYKLPSILFSLLGTFSTYRLGERLYSAPVGRNASLILGGCLAMIMVNNDIKTDTILISAIVFSIWMLVTYLDSRQWKHLVGASVGIAAAVLAKGPIGLMMPALTIGGHLLLKREWKKMFDRRWAVLLLIVGLLLIPMCIGLYRQHGLQGLRFFFWTQSFGRITGESRWSNDTTVFFFTHVFLWSFIPWTAIALAGLFKELRNVWSNMRDSSSELFLISGTVLVTLALSLSRFKLPHYIFIVYPLIAILAAKYIRELRNHSNWAWTQLILSCSAAAVMAILLIYCFPGGGYTLPILLVLLIIASVLFMLHSIRSDQVVIPTFILSIGIGLGLNLHFYRELLPYQANSMVGKWAVENKVGKGSLIGFSTGGHALDFYAGQTVPWMNNIAMAKEAIGPGMVVYASEERYRELLRHGPEPRETKEFRNFTVQNLTVEFLDPRTRDKAVKNNYLLFY